MAFEALTRLFHSRRWDEIVFWALDLEMSGLHPGTDRILSVGMVPIRGGVIRYGERFQSLVRPPELEGLSQEGLRAHHLLPGDIAHAPGIGEVLPEVDRRLREGALLLHFAELDLAFLRNAYRRCGLKWPKPRLVDTMNLLLDLQEEFGLTYLFISHDLAVVKYMADEILVMSGGEIVERGSSEEIYARPQHPYTRQLLGAIPRGVVTTA